MVEIQPNVRAYLAQTFSVLLVLFHAYTCIFGLFEPLVQRPVHLLLLLVIVYLLYPLKGRFGTFLDLLFIFLAVAPILHLIISYDQITERAGDITPMEVILGVMLIFSIAEGCRRVIGVILTVIAAIALAYNIWGNFLPLPGVTFRHISFARIIATQYLSTEGIWTAPLAVSATYVVPFLLFANVLDATESRAFLMKVALKLFGKLRGGPAKVAVVSSGLFGMISGSAIANVVTTGMITIPLMKKVGFRPSMAGGLEACASTGGQLAPPIMGAAAFIIAEFLGLSYLKVLIAAATPAFLYYFTLYLYISFLTQNKARPYKLDNADLETISITMGELIKRLILVFGPLIYLIYSMIGDTVQRAAIKGVGALFAATFVTGNFSTILGKPIEISVTTAKNATVIAMATALGGVIIGVITSTGINFKIANLMIQASAGNIFILLALAMITSIIFGMGLTTTAAYILVALLVVPVVVDTGIAPMAAHLFCFYFAILSSITPPVAIASFAAAPIAGVSAMAVGWQGFRILICLLPIPFGFIYYPALLFVEGTTFLTYAMALITNAAAIYYILGAITGYFLFRRLTVIERTLLFLISVSIMLTIVPFLFKLFAISCVLLLYLFLWYKRMMVQRQG